MVHEKQKNKTTRLNQPVRSRSVESVNFSLPDALQHYRRSKGKVNGNSPVMQVTKNLLSEVVQPSMLRAILTKLIHSKHLFQGSDLSFLDIYFQPYHHLILRPQYFKDLCSKKTLTAILSTHFPHGAPKGLAESAAACFSRSVQCIRLNSAIDLAESDSRVAVPHWSKYLVGEHLAMENLSLYGCFSIEIW